MPEKKIKYNYGDSEQFFKEHVEQERKPRGENSCVAPDAFFLKSTWIYVFVICKHVFEHEHRIGFVSIDI